jgi:hypothetical protein
MVVYRKNSKIMIMRNPSRRSIQVGYCYPTLSQKERREAIQKKNIPPETIYPPKLKNREIVLLREQRNGKSLKTITKNVEESL